jgi:hypothetical protein
VQVPLLCISWYANSTSSSTVIVLDSTVVLAVDVADSSHPFRLEIRHAATRENRSLPDTRTFAAPNAKVRDAWVYNISQSLLNYEKSTAAARKYVPMRRYNLDCSPMERFQASLPPGSISPNRQQFLARIQSPPRPIRTSSSAEIAKATL